jgi:hypothetical protein
MTHAYRKETDHLKANGTWYLLPLWYRVWVDYWGVTDEDGFNYFPPFNVHEILLDIKAQYRPKL